MEQYRPDDGKPNTVYVPPGSVFAKVNKMADRTDGETTSYRTNATVAVLIPTSAQGVPKDVPA